MSAPAPAPVARHIGSIDELLAVALALIGDPARLSPAEQATATGARPEARIAGLAAAVAERMYDGADPLGEALMRLRTAAERRGQGQTLTPPGVIGAMLGWARMLDPVPERIVDPGAGTGRFALAAARAFPEARIVAVEADPMMAILLRAAAAVPGLSDRIELRIGDYCALPVEPAAGRTLFLGNPPYLRHHALAPAAKARYAAIAARFGVRASRLAGSHLHFFLRSLDLARPGDALCFVTAAEWLDVGYGAALRTLLAGPFGLVSVDRVAAAAAVFDGTLATAAITATVIGRPVETAALRSVAGAADLTELGRGPPVPVAALRTAAKWSVLFDRPPSPAPRRPGNGAAIGDVFRVSRGQVTGANRIWIAGPHAVQAALPPAVLVPSVTRARDLFAAGPALTGLAALRRVIDLPPDPGAFTGDERAAIDAFLAWARAQGAELGYVARHRRPWYAVRLHPPAPILCSYMARRPPVFVRNPAGARHVNIAHGLYPREPLDPATLDRIAAWLNRASGCEGGRTYAGGLIKFEPREIERLPLPPLAELLAA